MLHFLQHSILNASLPVASILIYIFIANVIWINEDSNWYSVSKIIIYCEMLLRHKNCILLCERRVCVCVCVCVWNVSTIKCFIISKMTVVQPLFCYVGGQTALRNAKRDQIVAGAILFDIAQKLR